MPGLLNFDLAIDPHGDGYRARVLSSPAGEADNTFVLPFTDQDLEILVLRIVGSVGRARRNLRRLESTELRLLEDFGGQLFQAVFTGSVRRCFERSLAAAEAGDSGLRLRLQLAPALQNTPWEYLYDREYGFLSLSPETPVVRYVPIPKPVRPLPVRPPLRILAMIAAPTDVPHLQHEEEWNKLHSSLGELIDRDLVQLDRLQAGSLAALQRPLRQREYHVLHFVGHGLYDENARDGALVLEDDNGQSRLVTGRDLGMMLRGRPSLRMVVLNACEGARSAVDDPFGGVAQALVRQGIPAVIAMQFEISDPAALVFSQSFYQALADLLPADVAMVEARRAVFAADNEVEWATPVIYLRAPDGRIFAELPPEIPDPEIQRREREEAARLQREETARLEREEAARLQREETARLEREEAARRETERLQQQELERQEAARREAARREAARREREEAERREAARREREEAERREAARREREAEERRRVGEWNGMAEVALQEGRWDDAVGVLENLVQAGHNDPGTVQRLEFARTQRQRDILIAEARRLYSAGQWADVLTMTEQLARLGVRTKETDRLTATARTKLEKSNREQARKQAREEAQVAGRPIVAELPTRLAARLVDLGIYLIPLLVLTPSSTAETSTELTTGDTLRLGGIVLTIAIYEVVLTKLLGGTLGKRLFRLRVVRADDGSPVGWRESLLRWFIQFLAWATCIGPVLLYISPYWDTSGRRQAWHDRAAATTVLKLPSNQTPTS